MRSLVFKAKLLEAVLLKKPTWKVKSFLLSPLSHLVLPAGASPAGPSRRGDTPGWAGICVLQPEQLCVQAAIRITSVLFSTSHHTALCPSAIPMCVPNQIQGDRDCSLPLSCG